MVRRSAPELGRSADHIGAKLHSDAQAEPQTREATGILVPLRHPLFPGSANDRVRLEHRDLDARGRRVVAYDLDRAVARDGVAYPDGGEPPLLPDGTDRRSFG